MKRISANDVVDAYIATGMFPVFNRWSNRTGDGACGLTAVGKFYGVCAKPREKDRELAYSQLLELPHCYVCGFTWGFDYIKKKPKGIEDNDNQDWQDFKDGFADGKAARAAVTAHFAKAPAEQEEVVNVG